MLPIYVAHDTLLLMVKLCGKILEPERSLD